MPGSERPVQKLLIVGITFFLFACGGGGGTGEVDYDDDNGTGSSLSSGVVVDPYISGAVIEEIDPDGRVVQSTTSNSLGAFSFNQPVSVGSVLRMREGSFGQHAGTDYTVALSRLVSENVTDAIVISPLTTLLIEATSESELQQLLAAAGLTSIDRSELYQDPMAGLGTLTSVSDQQLQLLQAAMAVGSYLSVEDSNYLNGQALNDCIRTTTTVLNADDFDSIKTALSGDAEITTLLLDDYIQAAAATMDSLTAQVSSGKLLVSGMATAASGRLSELTSMTKEQSLQRSGLPSESGINGQLVFENNCASCHDLTSGTTMDLSNNGNLIPTSHRADRLTADEITALSNYLDGTTNSATTDSGTSSGTSDPSSSGATTTTDAGATLFSNNCAFCHNLTSGTMMDLSGDGSKISAKLAGGHNGVSLTTAEVTTLAAYLDGTSSSATTDSGTSTDGSTSATTNNSTSCTSCHGQPPNGSASPNTAGAHAAHAALAIDCNSCHLDNTHADGWVDLGFPATVDAKSGTATDNGDGTCSSISCHGGNTTPDWWSGSITVTSQCLSCHEAGNGEYNSFNSGEHSEHSKYDCTYCHNVDKMTDHFGNLTTTSFETDPASAIGGGNTKVGSYNGTSCSSIACHGSESWR